MKARLMPQVSANVFRDRPWNKSGVVTLAIEDAIAAGPEKAIPLEVSNAEDLKPIQHACHVYAVRRGYRVQTLTDKKNLIVYVRAVRAIQGLFHRAGRPVKPASLALRALRNQGNS